LYLISNSTAQYQFGNAFYTTLDRNLTIVTEMGANNHLNAGLDYILFNNRLTGSVDLYKERLRIYCCTLKTHLSLVFKL
jgi:iron complex outermembrane receptor protein